jgi:hypothetical protein
MVVAAGALAAGGMVVSSSPAFAASENCTGGSGTATLSPGITNVPTQQTISASNSLTGCTGGKTGSAQVTTNNLKTLATGNPPQHATCAGLFSPPPNGTLIASGGATSIVWSAGGTSTGTAKLKSNGIVAQDKVVVKITGGPFAGKKLKGVVHFVPAPGEPPCGNPPNNGPLKHVNTTFDPSQIVP